MKTLSHLALAAVAVHIDSPHVGPNVYLLPPTMKCVLLELLLSHDLLKTKKTWSDIVRKEFFKNFRQLILPRSDQMNDLFMNTIAASGCQLNEIFLSVPMIPTDERRAKLTGRGVSALLGTQDALERLTLIWCVNFKQGVLNRIKSDRLKYVEIHGDAVCSCFGRSGYVVRDDEVQLYQRDVSFLAINNRTITHLHLDSVILNLADCHSLFSALSDSLEYLVIKIIRYYTYCEGTHCFYGQDFIPFCDMIDSKCHRLRSASFFCYQADWQQNRQLRMDSTSIEKLALEGHVFECPPIFPSSNLRKLKISLNGSETVEHFVRYGPDYIPNLERLYIHLIENYTAADEFGLMWLFSHLGPKIASITDINPVVFNQFSFLIGEYCTNLKMLGILRLTAANMTGFQLLPYFRDEERAKRLKHLRLTIDHASQSLLRYVVDNCPNLRTLDVAYCQTMDDTLLIRLAVNCNLNLRTLDISYCSLITDESMQAIAINCSSSLEEICMLETQIGDQGVTALATYCYRLRVCRYDEKLVDKEITKKLKEICVNRVIV